MLRVWYTYKLEIMFLPIFPKIICIFGTYHNDGRFPSFKFSLVPAQLRQVRTAERSNKAAVEHQQDIRFSKLV